MRFFPLFPLAIGLLLGIPGIYASETSANADEAVQVLNEEISAHPDQLLVIFQSSLQANPDYRKELIETALLAPNLRADTIRNILYASRLEFPGDDAFIAEVALGVIPERSEEIRQAFDADEEAMTTALTQTDAPEKSPREASTESQRLDAAISEAIARVSAKVEAQTGLEQKSSTPAIPSPKADEVRIPSQSREVDESNLLAHLPLDQVDERKIAPGSPQVDDATRPLTAIRLDETKFGGENTDGQKGPAMAKVKSVAPAGRVGLPRRPALARSGVYYIPAPANPYQSTIDQETSDVAPPALIIRPPAMRPSMPR